MAISKAALLFLIPMALLATDPVRGQSVALSNGETLIGRVVHLDDERVIMNVRFPDNERRVLSADDISPVSLYRLHHRRADLDKAEEQIRLGELARKLGLYGYAMAAFEEARSIDSSLDEDIERHIKEVRKEVAKQNIDRARSLIEHRHPAMAGEILRRVKDRYELPEDSVKEIDELLEKTKSHEAAENPGKWVEGSKLQAILDEAESRLSRAQEVMPKPLSAVTGGTQVQRKHKILLEGLQPALEKVLELRGVEDDAQATQHLNRVRGRLKERIVQHHLALATLYLKRPAVPEAEDEIAKAFDLDPDNKRARQLLDKVLDSRTSGDWIRGRREGTGGRPPTRMRGGR